MTALLLGVDIGSSSTKAVVTDANGLVVATATRAHEMSLPRPGWAEMDADNLWWAEVCDVVRELTATVGADAIRGVCVSGVGPCLQLCDARQRPVRAAILYGIDVRAGAEIAELTERLGADRIVERGGSALSSQAVGPKMLWVQRHEPQVWAAARRCYSSHSYVVGKLTGEYVLDHHTASQYDPLYAIHDFGWDAEWAPAIAAGLELPRLAWPHEVIGEVTADAAGASGLRAGTPVSMGTVDAWAEALSVGVRKPGEMMLMYGTTAFFVSVLKSFSSSPGLWTTAGVEPSTHTLAAGTATAGALTSWVRSLTGDVPIEQLVAEAAAIPPGAEGLLVLPYFQGERTPIYDPQARGVIAGLSLRHGRGHVYRAVYEGTAFGIRHVLETFAASGGAPDRIVAVGGGTKGGLWPQIVSDVCGREQHIPHETVGACYGDALLAAVGTGLVPPDTTWVRPGRQVEPDPARRERYDALYDEFRRLYPATRDTVHALAGLQEAD